MTLARNLNFKRIQAQLYSRVVEIWADNHSNARSGLDYEMLLRVCQCCAEDDLWRESSIEAECVEVKLNSEATSSSDSSSEHSSCEEQSVSSDHCDE